MNNGVKMIKAVMAQRDESNRQFAKAVGVSHVTISNILDGGAPRNDTLIALRKIRGLGSLQPEHFTTGA